MGAKWTGAAVAAFSALNKFGKKKARGVEIDVKIDGATELHRNIDLLSNLLTDFSYYFDLIEEDFYESLKQIFKTNGAFEGRKGWKPLSKGYAAAKAIEFPGKGILERTGALKKSFIMKGAPGNIYKRTKDQLLMGSDLKAGKSDYILGQLHSAGFVRPKMVPVSANVLRWMGPNGPVFAKSAKAVKVPARPILAMSDKQRDRWSKFAHMAFMQQWNSKAAKSNK